MLNPGHPKAIEQGCKCPADLNQDGQGTFNATVAEGSTRFVVEESCPVHGKATWREEG